MIMAEGLTIDTTYALGILGGAGAVIVFLYRALIVSQKDKYDALAALAKEKFDLLLAEKDRDVAELISVKKSYQEVASEAIKSAQEMANYYRGKKGEPPIILAPPVISESHSPPTAKQVETAVIATMRASLAKIKEDSGQAPRQEHTASSEQVDVPAGKTMIVVTGPAPLEVVKIDRATPESKEVEKPC